MSAREEVLAAVRAALVGVVPAPDPPRAPQVRPPRDVVAHFAERVADYRAVVERCARDELEARVAAALAPASTVVVPPGLDLAVAGAVEDAGLAARELEEFEAVVTRARVGIAETGTIVLDHGPGQGRRALTLVPDRHVCVVAAGQVVLDVADALAVLDPRRPQTWVSGPSATSDIELERVEGVHGPRTLHVIVVDDAQPLD
ncbi:LUD domain-containing protein [Nocardioides sp. SYSU D00038]|uniref:LutC/YkgG family protein n=1 Tax=Nocardioides sp. SYSU D00038 TaxID=2812554 RepID=UPI00196708AD|nr:LUD domain-containing protein [Nocardioides sp. SYSU D00038]